MLGKIGWPHNSASSNTLIYMYYNVLHGDTMPISVSLRLPDEIHEQLEDIAEDTDRSKSYLIKKAIEQYLEEYADYQTALDRLNDKDDVIISSKELRKRLAARN